jgi:cytochrome b
MNKPPLVTAWDPFIRIFHWSLVVSFVVSWVTQEEFYNLHLQAGYATLGLICMRLAWGFIACGHARFIDFIYSPKAIIAYLKSLPGNNPKRYIGHNPAGGAMVILLLAGLFVVTLSGIALDAAENWSGPMAGMNLFRYTSLIKSIHSLSTNLLLVAIALHLLGVGLSSLAHRENLPKSMITGKKRKL